MSQNRIVLISDRPSDLEFFRDLSKSLGIPILQINNTENMGQGLGDPDHHLVIWDADHSNIAQTNHPLCIDKVREFLTKYSKPSRVILLLDKPANIYPELFTEKGRVRYYFQHVMIRRTDGAAKQSYVKMLGSALKGAPYEFEDFFTNGEKIESITLKSSDQKRPAVEAIASIFEKRGIENRLASKAAQAVDEFIMNAIFDAARDKEGRPMRNLLDRGAKFEFGLNERVLIRAAYNDTYVGICVSDQYGSLGLETAFRYINQNFKDKEYQIRRSGPGAGLGLYGIVGAGLSMILSCVKENRTDAMIFFSNTQSYKVYRQSFQFVFCDSIKAKKN